MWNDDGDWSSYQRYRDEEEWQRVRSQLFYKIDNVATLLYKLKVLKVQADYNWYNFIDRHWKV